MELIVKNGTVRIPSIFMFKDYEEITTFLGRAEEAGCTVIFENEDMVISPRGVSTEDRTKLHIYSLMVGNREMGNAYLRYLGGIEKMTLDNAWVE